MSRVSRNIYSTPFYHVMTQGINKKYIFNEEQEIKYYIKTMYNLREKFNLKIVSYCIMNNHAHMLVNLKDITELSKYMQILNSKYAKFYNKKHERVGYVFRDRFKSEPIYNEKYLYNCIKYIYDNPVKAGICDKPEDYPYSNYKEIPTNMIDNSITFVDTDEEKQQEYLNEIDKFFEDNNIKNILDSNELLKELTIILSTKYELSFRKIEKLLNVNRERLKKIIK